MNLELRVHLIVSCFVSVTAIQAAPTTDPPSRSGGNDELIPTGYCFSAHQSIEKIVSFSHSLCSSQSLSLQSQHLYPATDRAFSLLQPVLLNLVPSTLRSVHLGRAPKHIQHFCFECYTFLAERNIFRHQVKHTFLCHISATKCFQSSCWDS